MIRCSLFFFFFFQAEDGIRDRDVTGVQTCALPISLLVANHVSWLDPLVIMAHAPCLPVAKSEVARWPVVGSIAVASGVQFVERGSALSGARLVRAAARALSAGASVLNFPEGTTSQGGSILPFRPGAFRAARAASVPVVPIVISYRFDELA